MSNISDGQRKKIVWSYNKLLHYGTTEFHIAKVCKLWDYGRTEIHNATKCMNIIEKLLDNSMEQNWQKCEIME